MVRRWQAWMVASEGVDRQEWHYVKGTGRIP